MERQPLFVLIPGGGMSDWVWAYLRTCLDYPSVTVPARIADNTYTGRLHATLWDVVDHVVELIPPGSKDVVLVAHSGGGILAAMAARKLADRIRHIVFIAANIPAHGVTTLSGLPLPVRMVNRAAIRMQMRKDTIPIARMEKMVRKNFLNGVSEDVVQYVLGQVLLPEPVCLIDETMDWTDYPLVDMTYIVLSRDRTIKPDLQYQMGANLGVQKYRVIDSCHMVMLDKPVELASILNKIASE